MKKLQTFLFISAALTLSACATNYTKNAGGLFSGTGYEDIPIDSSTYRIVFYGSHGSTSLELVDRYAFYRAAELSEEKGFDYFVVLQTGMDEKQRIAWNTIRMFKGPPSDNEFAVFDAQTVLKEMAAFIHRDDGGANR
jgi:hypothetical protein